MPDRAGLVLLFGAAVVLLLGAPASARANSPVVDRVPTAIPANGIRITGCCVFMPPTVSRGLISKHRALTLARAYARASVWHRPAFLLTRVPGPISVAPDAHHSSFGTLRNVPAWVVTFTSDKPQRVGVSSPEPLVTHFSAALDARNGRFIRGFYTP
jgi:hypothetical protein